MEKTITINLEESQMLSFALISWRNSVRDVWNKADTKVPWPETAEAKALMKKIWDFSDSDLPQFKSKEE